MTSPREQAGRTPPQVDLRVGAWEVTATWPPEADQGGPWKLTVQPREGATVEDIGPGISSTVLRRIDFAGLSELWRASRDVGIAMDDLRAALRSAATQGVTDGYLALLSAAYVTLVQAGRPSVTVALADLVGRQPETIRQHLVRARNAGMLTSVRGAAGGQLTDKARSVLGQFDDELFDRSDGS